MKKSAVSGLAAFWLFTLCLFSIPAFADSTADTNSVEGAISADRLNTPAAPFPLEEGVLARPLLLLDIARAGERLVAVGEQGVILLSDDQGQRWRQAEVPVSLLLTGLYFVDAQTGWAVGHDGVVLHSDDGGEHWRLQLDGNGINRNRITTLQQAITELQADSQAEATGALSLDDLEYALEEAQYASEEGASVPLLDIWFRNRSEGYAIGAYGMMLQTRDGGQSWHSQDHLLPNPDRFHLNAIHADRSGRVYLAGEAGTLLRQQHDGRWQALDAGYDGSFFAIQSAADHSLYLMGLRGHLFHSQDGERWQQQRVPASSSINALLFDDRQQQILLGLGGLLLHQQGQEFVSLSPPGRGSFSAGLRQGSELILVGDAGITRVELGAQGEE